MFKIIPPPASRPVPLITRQSQRAMPARVQALGEDVLAWLALLDQQEPALVDWMLKRVAEYAANRPHGPGPTEWKETPMRTPQA